MELNQFQLDILILLWVRFIEMRDITAVLLTAVKKKKKKEKKRKENFNVCVHLDVHEPIWFKFGMIIDTIKMYKLILA